MSIYTKQLEDENEHLRLKLAEAQEQLDREAKNPLEESLKLLIEASIKHQKKIRSTKAVFRRNSDLCELKLRLPRQIGLSTSIVNAAVKFFAEVDVLHNPGYSVQKYDLREGCIVRHHASVNNFIGMRVSCVIVDPWSVIYGEQSREWYDIKDKIMSRIDMDKPYLLIMAG